MEKIFNFFRFTNRQFAVFDINKSLVLSIVNGDGRVTRLETYTSSTGAEIISNALVEFSECSENLYKGHQLIHVRSGNIINYNTSMDAAGVLDNDEICLIKKHNILNTTKELNAAPTQAKIDEITGNINNNSDKSSNIKPNFVRLAVGGHSYIRNFLIQMAIESAYIISPGPYADFLIEYFKQKIIGRRKHQADAVKSLTDLGFERSRCEYAIKLKKNIYAEALNWLIDHSEDSSNYHTYTSSISLVKTINQNVQDKFHSLHQIIRIYGRTGQHHCEKLLKTFMEMGFEEEDALNALRRSDWDPTAAAEMLCSKEVRSETQQSSINTNVLDSPGVQNYLGDPEVFMTIIYILGSGAGSSGIENNWESTKVKYRNVAFVLKRYNDEKHYNIMNNINFL